MKSRSACVPVIAGLMFSCQWGGAQSLRLLVPSGYLPQIPVLVRVELRQSGGQRDWDAWNAEAVLSVDQPGVTLSTNRVTLRNGLGSALVIFSGSEDFTLSVAVGGMQANRSLRSLATDPIRQIGGTLPGAASTWSGIVQVTNDVIVPSTHTLTIQSNTLVLINGVASGTVAPDLIVNGTVQSSGTEDQPVTITCADPGLRWGQIRHDNAQPSLYRHTIITRGGRATGEGHTGQAPIIRPTNSKITFESCSLTDHAEIVRGAAGYGTPGKIMQASGSDITFNDCLLARSRMGPEISGTALLVTNSYIMDMGGPDDADGIYIHAQSGGQICALRNSVLAAGDDDGIDTLDSTVLVDGCIIRDWNNLFEDAKGISVFNGATHVRRSLIVDSTVGISAKWSAGATTLVTINNSTITGNLTNVLAQLKDNAPGPFIDYRITNCVLWGGNAVHSDFAPTNFIIRYCDVSEDWPGTGNFSEDPFFVNSGDHNYHLQDGSPCIDAGDPASPTDPDGSPADLGVYPFDASQSSSLYVNLTSPASGAVFIGPTNITLEAVAMSSTGSVARVEFFQGTAWLGEALSAPFSLVWSNALPAAYVLRAVATDNGGLRATSAPVNLTIAASEGPTTNAFIALGSTWKYLDNGSDQGTAWVAPTFDDSGWRSGPAPLGYCDGSGTCSYTFRTTVGWGPVTSNKYVTTYFRRPFSVEDPSRVEGLILNLLRDDGAVLYINGQEVFRISMPAGPITYLTNATGAANYSYVLTNLPASTCATLVAGTNVLAAEIHQGSRTSSDIVFEMELRGIISAPTNQRPMVTITDPPNNLTLAAPGALTLAAIASDVDGMVTNVAFYANGAKLGDDATSPYSFDWDNIPAGNYALAAVATDDVGLSATSSVVNLIVSTNIAPPVIANQTPAPGTIFTLTQITVVFSKAVVGVAASDLLVNGVPATGLSGSGTTYTFAFAPPAYGDVSIAWAAAHGITDTFTPPHAFDGNAPGATWQYQLVDATPPAVSSVSPAPGAVVAALASVSVLFSEPVTGVDASDLLVNSVPASTLSGSGAGPYTFGFAQPPSGGVQLRWAAGHGIRDAVGNLFAGGAWSYMLDTNATGVVISEIMYHPSSEDVREEYIELLNRGAGSVDLSGWRFSGGVFFDFPSNTVIAPADYLVVAANVTNFTAKYPGVTNVVGGWAGTLRNSRDDIDLDDAAGRRVDSVRYADEGDWAIRQRGFPSPLPSSPYRGWEWFKEHDGLGKSLELINPALPNQYGQNWAASIPANGTPGRANSVASNNIAPLIVEVKHLPVLPKSTDTVTITARIIDESDANLTVTLHSRVDAVSPPPFAAIPMRDDGLHGDGVANDGIFGAVLPAQPQATIVEFYVEAADALGNVRTWPAPARETNGVSLGQAANALYQVDDTVYAGDQPIYRLIMKESERAELAAIQNGTFALWPSLPGTAQSDAQMNGTFISVDGTGTECRYVMGIKNRGHGTRNRKPNNFRINFPSDNPWKGVGAINLNGQFTHVQIFGAALCQQAGVAGAESRAVQLRVNGTNLALTTGSFDRTYGSYAANEVIDADWADHHFPLDGNGNAYRVIRDIYTPSANFDYRGTDPHTYTNTYFKRNNASEDDWTDLIAMLRIMGTNDLFSTENVRRVVNVEQWMTHLAVMAIFANDESGLDTGYNDDYNMYCGVNDPRFLLVYYDLDTILGEGTSSPGPSSSIWRSTTVHARYDSGGAMGRFLHWPDFEPIYYQTLQRLLDTTFSKPQYDALLDQTLASYVPADVIARMKTWMDRRRDYINTTYLTNVPPVVSLPVATIAGEPRSPTPLTAATLSVGGDGITSYRFQLNTGAYSGEIPVATPILLSGLPANSTNTVYVIGKNTNGIWQSLANPTASRTWIVNTGWLAVRINEVLAGNDAAVNYHGTFPDLIELFNEGSTAVNLDGLRLTDDPANPDKFIFPNNTTLASGAHLVLYANNNDGTPGLHLGFALNQTGEGVYLFNRADAGGALLDSVVFGLQLADRSIGRLGNDGTFVLTQPTFGAANVAQPLGDARALKINEWLAAGHSPYPDDFVELFNPNLLPVALGELHLTDAPIGAPGLHPLAPLSFIEAAGFAVFIADGQPEDGADHLNFQLASEQGRIGLFAADLSLIDHVVYGPQQTDVSFGRCPDGGLKIVSLPVATPGAVNQCPALPPQPQYVNLIAISNVWRYDVSGANLGTAWKEPGYNDSAWPSGAALLFEPPDGRTYTLPETVRTWLPPANGIVTYYFRARFTVPAGASFTSLQFTHVVDDGAVFFLNGNEVGRFNLPSGTITFTNLASSVTDASYQGPVNVALTNLVAGTNVFAVELHQNSATSADLCFGLLLDGVIITNTPAQAGVLINEVMANNATQRDPDGSTPDWVEFFNPSSNAVDLAEMSVSDNPGTPRRWVFPAGSILPAQGYLVVRFDADKPASATNTGFGLKASGDALYLFNTPAEGGGLRDSIIFGLQSADWSIGRIPTGGAGWDLTIATPGDANVAAPLGPVADLKVNEWMAAPLSGDDWFEIYNPGPLPVALGRLWLTDDLNDRMKHQIPPLSFLGGGTNAWQQFVAEGKATAVPDHVSFALRASGEAIGISTADGVLIDGVAFGPQLSGVSQGRLPDGDTNIISFPGTASPGEANYLQLTSVVINEVLTHTDPPFEDAIELYNPTDQPVEISGWWLSDSKSTPRKYRIEPGTVIEAGGYKVFYEFRHFNNSDAAVPFALSSAKGDQVYLSAATLAGALTGYRTSVKFGPAENGVSFGRFPTSVGVDFTALGARTFGQDDPASVSEFETGEGLPNAYPKVGPVVISEIMYHPLLTNDSLEFIELRNITTNAVPLFDPACPTNTWRLRDAVDFEFPPNLNLPPGGELVVVGFDPQTNLAALAEFQTAYGANALLVGPFRGKLENNGESIELYKPDAPEAEPGPDFGLVPYFLADRVEYDNQAPWPAGANGLGSSLQKINLALYGNEPTNWLAAAPHPGGGLDTDADGMPDAWETRYGLRPDDPADAALDTDGDGVSNLNEYLSGTAPNDPNSYLRVERIALASGQVLIQFTAVAARTYSVLYQDSLAAGAWLRLTNVAPQPVTQNLTIPDTPPANAQRFYRLVTPARP